MLLLLAASFAAGMYFAGQGDRPQAIVDSSDGASYQGGYDQTADSVTETTRQPGGPSESGQVIEVREGELIQDAVKRARPGDTIRVHPGVYSETVYVDKDDIRLLGIIREGARATLDGNGSLNDAILYSGNGFVVENFKIVNYKGNAIMGQAGNNFEIRNNIIADTGIYGIFPQLGKNGIVEHNIVSGIADAAIYVGMSDNVHVAHNDVFDSVAGIEIENSRHAIVENNYVHNNTGGILAFITPGLPIKTTFDVIIRNNFVEANNHVNFGAPGSTVAGIPAGTGILIMAADDVVIEDNIISNHKTAGILIADHANSGNITFDPESEPNPDRVAILNNMMIGNGYDTINEIKALMLTELKSVEPDIVAVGGGQGSCIINRHRYRTVGLSDYTDCDFTNTDDVITYQLDQPVAPREIKPSERGKIAYLGVCAGCHSYKGHLIGPPVVEIQEIYKDNPMGVAGYIANPVKKRQDYPEMPSQAYLGGETMAAVAEYMMSRKD
ncbi:MAG: cytochrome-c peroxidase [Gammaproteobacteria bacterium]|nr:cytochrome-c peroxidase [Gammaproteobacteria bacterium]